MYFLQSPISPYIFTSAMKTIRITITGKVHKVGYRFFVKQMAETFAIEGMVRYMGNDAVEVIATGEDKNLEKFTNYCRLGCQGSDPTEVTIEIIKPELTGSFEIL